MHTHQLAGFFCLPSCREMLDWDLNSEEILLYSILSSITKLFTQEFNTKFDKFKNS